MNKEIVYWAVASNFAHHSLLDLTPKPLLKYLSLNQSKNNSITNCPAIREKHKNTFFTTIPFNINVNFNGDSLSSNRSEISKRPSPYNNSYSFDLQVLRIFFAENTQTMEVSPAFLHQTSYSQYGYAPSGAFDISNWFRPSSPMFILWPEIRSFFAKEGEAHLYLNFPNTSRVELKTFVMTDKLNEIMVGNVSHKRYVPKQNFNSLYSRFSKSGQKQTILKEIKNNIVQ